MHDALVIYKGKPALARGAGDKLLLELPSGERLRVRPKDVLLLHPGPALLQLSPPQGEVETAWALLEGQTVSLRELAELVYGQYTPEAAYAAYQLTQNDPRFVLEGSGARARTQAELEAILRDKRHKEEREQAFLQGVQRLRQKAPAPEDAPLLAELQALALGKRKESPVLRALGHPETPESAHRLLLDLGVFRYENPHPQRLGLRLFPPELAIPPLPPEQRTDLTAQLAYAIDDPGSQDPDDAIFVEPVASGYRLLVHVADVAALVTPGSPLDQEAMRRGANLYLPEGTIPMLPFALTEALGLGLKEVSPALTFELWLSKEGELLQQSVYPSLVRVQRITYQEALEVAALQALQAVAEVLQARRVAQGALDIALPEVKIRVEGEAVHILPLPPYPSRVWVREAMLLAGYAAAQLALQADLPFPFATQEAPSFQVEASGLAGMWAQRKGLKRTQLKSTPASHHGLGLPFYAQVTSPLRRYLDLVAHQQLRAWLRGQKPLSQAELLERVGAAEAMADLVREAERKSRDHWILVHLLQKGYEGSGTLVERRGLQGLFFMNELGLVTQVALEQNLPLNTVAQLRFRGAELPRLEHHFSLLTTEVG